MGSTSQPARVRICQRAAEVVMLSVACLAPWAFGAVEAWAELGIAVGIALIALLGLVAGRGAMRAASRGDVPGLALMGLALLALAQAAPLPEGLLRWVSPATASLRREVLPARPESVLTDPGPTVPLAAPTVGQDPEAALRMAMRLGGAWLLFQGVVGGLEPGFGPTRRFAVATVVNATLMALFSLVQMLSWNGKIYWLRPSPAPSAGPFVSHNHLAAYLNLGLGFATAFALGPGRQGRGRVGIHSRLWWAYAAGILIIGILASLSRNGFLSMAVAMAATVVLLRPKAWQVVTGAVAVGVLVVGLLVALGSSVAYGERIATLTGGHAYQDRLAIWQDALRAWPSYPIWGTGLGSFPVVMDRFSRSTSLEVVPVYLHAENEYVEWLVEGGVVGLGLALAGVVGVAELARRALRAAQSASERALVLGACFGGLAILVESLGDFALHIPGVAVSVAILAGHLSKLGLEARGAAPTPAPRDAPAYLSALTGPVLGVVVVFQAIGLARSEAAYRASGRPWPGAGFAAVEDKADPVARLERERAAIERSLALRPNWAEGYQELGFVLVGLYKQRTAEGLRSDVPDPELRGLMSTHYWLHRRVHAPPEGQPLSAQQVLELPPVRADLVPAARAFLQARRCCPYLPMPHAELAALDVLLKDAEPAPVLIARALRLSGANPAAIAVAELLAIQVGDFNLAARIFRKGLVSTSSEWVRIADRAGESLPPEEILSRVVPNGRFAILFGEYLYSAPGHHTERDRFLREGLRRLPSDVGLSRAARLHLEARAWLSLGDRDRARSTMEQALVADPRQAAWRRELVQWLIKWGRLEEAHGQALVGAALAPKSDDARQALEESSEALARGTSASKREE